MNGPVSERRHQCQKQALLCAWDTAPQLPHSNPALGRWETWDGVDVDGGLGVRVHPLEGRDMRPPRVCRQRAGREWGPTVAAPTRTRSLQGRTLGSEDRPGGAAAGRETEPHDCPGHSERSWQDSSAHPGVTPRCRHRPGSAHHQVFREDGFVVLVNFTELLDLILCASLQKFLDFLQGRLGAILGLALVHRLRGQQVDALVAPFHGLDTPSVAEGEKAPSEAVSWRVGRRALPGLLPAVLPPTTLIWDCAACQPTRGPGGTRSHRGRAGN